MGRRGHRRAGVLIAALSIAAGTATAHAQDEDRARDMFRRGVDLMGEERFQEAAEAFRASYDAAPRVATMCNLALAYDRWGAYLDVAAEAYERCAREDASGRYREHATERARELRAEIEARTEPAPAPPPEQQLPPDTPAARPVVIQQTPTPSPRPMVLSTAPPPARVEPERGHGLLWAGVGVGVLAAGAIVGGAALAASANGDADELWQRYGDGKIPSSDRDGVELLDSAENKAAWSTALYVVGGVALAGAATFIILDLAASGEERPPSVAIAPLQGGAFATAHATF